LDLTASNPTRVGFAVDPDKLPHLDRESCIYTPTALGLASARAAVLEHFGLELPAEQVCLTASTSEAYGFLLSLLCDPGSCVLTPRPGYPLLDHLCALHDIDRVDYPLVYDGSWSLDLDGVKRAVEHAPGPRALVVISPNNPTGHTLDADELDALDTICSEHGLALIVDEVFAGYELAGARTPARPLATARRCLTFALSGLSKYAALPQLKLSWMLATGPSDLVREAMARLEIIADTYLNLAAPVQLALGQIFANAPGTRATISARLHHNHGTLRQRCARHQSAVTPLHCTHGWTQLVRLPAIDELDDLGWALDLIDNAGIRTQPGYLYDLPASLGPVLAVSLLTPPTEFLAGVEALLGRVGQRVAELR